MIEIDAQASDTGVIELDVHGYGKGAALQVDGNDLVHITDISPDDGTARVSVFASSHETAPMLWTGTVSLVGHLEGAATAAPPRSTVTEQHVIVYGFTSQDQVDSLRAATGMLPGDMGRWKGGDHLLISDQYAEKAIDWARRHGRTYEWTRTERIEPPR